MTIFAVCTAQRDDSKKLLGFLFPHRFLLADKQELDGAAQVVSESKAIAIL
jgi:hypothetical protein